MNFNWFGYAWLSLVLLLSRLCANTKVDYFGRFRWSRWIQFSYSIHTNTLDFQTWKFNFFRKKIDFFLVSRVLHWLCPRVLLVHMYVAKFEEKKNGEKEEKKIGWSSLQMKKEKKSLVCFWGHQAFNTGNQWLTQLYFTHNVFFALLPLLRIPIPLPMHTRNFHTLGTQHSITCAIAAAATAADTSHVSVSHTYRFLYIYWHISGGSSSSSTSSRYISVSNTIALFTHKTPNEKSIWLERVLVEMLVAVAAAAMSTKIAAALHQITSPPQITNILWSIERYLSLILGGEKPNSN